MIAGKQLLRGCGLVSSEKKRDRSTHKTDRFGSRVRILETHTHDRLQPSNTERRLCHGGNRFHLHRRKIRGGEGSLEKKGRFQKIGEKKKSLRRRSGQYIEERPEHRALPIQKQRFMDAPDKRDISCNEGKRVVRSEITRMHRTHFHWKN